MSEPRSCTVSFRDPEGMRHEVEVVASSLYEAVAAALVRFHASSLPDCASPGPMSELEVSVRTHAEVHRVRVQRFEQWLQGGGKNPSEASLKGRLREMLTIVKRPAR